MECPKCGSEMCFPRYMCDITKMVVECSKCNYSKIIESEFGYKDRLSKLLSKFNLGWMGYTDKYVKLQNGYIQYEAKRFNVGYGDNGSFTLIFHNISLDTVESLIKDLERK